MLPVSIQSKGNILRLLPMPQAEFEELYVGYQDAPEYDDLDIVTIEAFDGLVEKHCSSIFDPLSRFVIESILKSFAPKTKNLQVLLFIRDNLLRWFRNTSFQEDAKILKDNRFIIEIEGSEIHVQYISYRTIQVLYESNELCLCQLALVNWNSGQDKCYDNRIVPLESI
jgi:hypothetical protein